MRHKGSGALDRATLLALSQRFPEPEFGEGLVEEPVDVRRYIEALRRRAGLIVGLAVGIGLLVFLISLALPKSYTATAEIAPSVQATTSAASGSTTTQLNLATIQAYITSPAVLATAARQLGRESAASLDQKITTSLDPSANIVSITATDGSAPRSAQLANRVAQTFLSVRTAAERAQLGQQAALLTGRIQAAHAAGSTGLAAALQQQLSGIVAQEASAGSDLQLLALAPVPGSASSPRPTRNALFAFIAVLFIAVLAVGGRELLAPSISGGRELSALMGMPILGRVPQVANARRVRRKETDAAEAEAYRFLSKTLEGATWPNGPRFLAVTSAVRGEGKTTVVSRLGAALAETGNETLLVSADLRWPALHRIFGLPLGSGLSSELNWNGRRAGADSIIKRVGEHLWVLSSGPLPPDPAAVLTNEVVQSLFARIRQLDFEWVLFDLPPLIAVAETQLFVRNADAAVVVSRVGWPTAEQLSETRDLLNRLPVWAAGIVVLGVRAPGRQLALRNEGQIVAPADDGAPQKAGAQVLARSQPVSPAQAQPSPSRRRSSQAVSSGKAQRSPSRRRSSQAVSSAKAQPSPSRRKSSQPVSSAKAQPSPSRRQSSQKASSPEPSQPASPPEASPPASPPEASPPASPPAPASPPEASPPASPPEASPPEASPPASPPEASPPASPPEASPPEASPPASPPEASPPASPPEASPPAPAPDAPASPRRPRQNVPRSKSSRPASRRQPRQNAPRREPPPPK